MKKFLLFTLLTVFSNFVQAQQPAPLIWGASPFQDSIWAIDSLLWAPTINLEPTVTGSVVNGINGLAYDPIGYKAYAVLNITGSTRHLAEIDLTTGACNVKGDLGDRFSSITFDSFGQLYGATGDGGNSPETLFRIDKATGATTLVFAMGNGADGEVICFNRFNNRMYHWSGGGTPLYESWPIASTSYTPANIAVSGTAGGETFGALCLKANDFIISNISSNFRHVSASGNYGGVLVGLPDDLRGIMMPPRFALTNSVVCVKNGSVNLYSNCLALYDSVYYYWGDGNVTQLLATSAVTAAASHTYATPGNFTVTVQLFNGAVAKSTIITYPIVVNQAPIVSVSGSTVVCPGSTITLTGAGGGSSQWYSGGIAIPGATQNTYAVTAPGIYNMKKTNLNGCSDSAAVGVLVIAGQNPTITASSGSICNGSSFTINPTGASTYTFSGGAAVVNPTLTTSYSVTGTSSTGCSGTAIAVVNVSVSALPIISVASTQNTVCAGESVTLTANGANMYTWGSGGPSNSIVITPTAGVSYTVVGTDVVGCSNTATFAQIVSECTGLSKTSAVTSQIRVLPNPCVGKITVDHLNLNSTVEVYNALGQVIITTIAQQETVSLDLSGFSSGVYFVRVSQKDKMLGQIKIIKE